MSGSPCRCGHDGPPETHRCHTGRHAGPRVRCPRMAVRSFVATPGALAGMQLKVSAIEAWYCPECRALGMDATSDQIVAALADAHGITVAELTARLHHE